MGKGCLLGVMETAGVSGDTCTILGICCCCCVTQSCPILCDPMDYSPPGASVHGILLARILESEVAQSCPTLCDPMDCSPPGSSIHGIFQARALEWGATLPFPSPGDLPDPRIKTGSLALAGFFTSEPPGKLRNI